MIWDFILLTYEEYFLNLTVCDKMNIKNFLHTNIEKGARIIRTPNFT